MGVGRDMGYFQYTDDKAVAWSVRINKATGNNADLGFGAYSTGDPVLPAKKMRYALGVHASSGQRARTPVGSVTSDLWTGATNSFAQPAIGSGTPVSFQVTVTRGEKIDRAHDVANV